MWAKYVFNCEIEKVKNFERPSLEFFNHGEPPPYPNCDRVKMFEYIKDEIKSNLSTTIKREK